MSNISGKHFIFLFIYLLDLVSTFHPLHKIGFPCTCLLYYTTNIKNKKKLKPQKKNYIIFVTWKKKWWLHTFTNDNVKSFFYGNKQSRVQPIYPQEKVSINAYKRWHLANSHANLNKTKTENQNSLGHDLPKSTTRIVFCIPVFTSSICCMVWTFGFWPSGT